MGLYEKIISIYPSLTMEDFQPFSGTISLVDDGDGAYIARWEHPDLTRPTDEELGISA